MTPETPVERSARERRRVLFDAVAGRYDVSRQGYPAELVDTVLSSAGAGPGAAVLEIGCGTGQLTRQLAGRGLELTAIDIGASMVRAARHNVADETVRFQVSSFEDYAGASQFDLIVSATAFHWVDPAVGLAKAARLLRPGGWLALLTTGERYPEPLQSRLRELWLRYNRPSQEWASQPAWLAGLREAGLFGETVELNHARPLRLPAETVLGVERTRATYLSWPEPDQASFTADLEALLAPTAQVDVVQETFVAMAPTLSP